MGIDQFKGDSNSEKSIKFFGWHSSRWFSIGWHTSGWFFKGSWLRRIALTIVMLLVLAASPATALADTKKAVPAYHIYIDVNHPVLSLYRGENLVSTYPVALGTPQTQTPIGTWKIVDKQSNWGGGFGTRWLGLDVPWGIYGIHGTNRPELIGQYVSNGCIRMHNHDVEELFRLVPTGTPVVIRGDPLQHLRLLEHGDIGADVQLVQQRLQELGFYDGECDGIFGFGTQFALIYFQLSRGLPMLGKVRFADYRALGLK